MKPSSRRTLSSLIVSLLLAPTAPLYAAPLSVADRDVAGAFSAPTQDAFTLLGDTDDPKLVYYVPRRGGIAVQSPMSAQPIPRFSILARFPSYGFFAGQELTQLGGSLSTTSDLGALSRLKEEAAANGMRVSPAPSAKAGAKFMVSGQTNPVTGRIDVQCVNDTIEVNGKKIPVPVCHTRQSPDEPYELDTNVMYKFAFSSLPNNSTVAQDLSFQATTLPDWTPQLRLLMSTGAQWDSVLSASVDWVVRTSSLTRQARAHINWRRLLEQASVFAAVHNFACVDVEIQAFFRKIVDCSKEDECGVRIEYLQPDNTYGPRAPNDVNFVNVVNAVDRELRNELFNQIQPTLGRVSTRAGAGFTLRANYERLILERNEVRQIVYNAGPSDFEAQTTLNISCLLGGFEDGRVTFDTQNPGCLALLGR